MTDKWVKGRVRRHMRTGEFDFVDAYTWRGVFAAYKSGNGCWRAMHIPSGLSVEGHCVNLRTLKRAKEYLQRCHSLLPHSQWQLERPGLGTPETQEAVQRLMYEFR